MPQHIGGFVQHRAVSPARLDDQAQRQLATYWRVRISKTLDQLENEVRRMLRIETALEHFAQHVVQRLSAQRAAVAQLPAQQAAAIGLPNAPFEWVELGVAPARAMELKSRYRQLAKELHPDTATDSGRPTMSEVNAAYATSDLARMVRLEAQTLAPDTAYAALSYEDYIRQVEQATATYRQAYTHLLNTPLYSLYARASSATEDGWDFIENLARRISRALEAQKA